MFENDQITLDELLGTNVETAHFGMYTLRGNAQVRSVVKKMIAAKSTGASAQELAQILSVGRIQISKVYAEVYDTAVRECIGGVLEHALKNERFVNEIFASI